MGTESSESWQPRSRVGAVVAALLTGDTDAAEKVAQEPRDDTEPLVLTAAIRLAVRSLFDEDTPAESITEYVTTMARDIEVDPDIAEALIRAQFGDEEPLKAYPPQEVIDTTWSVFGYLCERQLGRDDSLELIAQAEGEVLEPPAS